MLNEHCEFFHMASLTTTARPPHRGAGSIAVTAVAPVQFAYRDKRLGDTETVMVETHPDVFYPTSTTVLLLRAARRVLASGPAPHSVWDLGCGTGIVAVVLARLLAREVAVGASDLSAAAVRSRATTPGATACASTVGAAACSSRGRASASTSSWTMSREWRSRGRACRGGTRRRVDPRRATTARAGFSRVWRARRGTPRPAGGLCFRAF